MNRKAEPEGQPVERVIVLIETAAPDELADIVARLADLPPWVVPVFVASPEEARHMESLLSRRNGIHVERAQTATDVSALMESLSQRGRANGYPSLWPRDLLRLSVALSSIQDQGSLLEELLKQALDATPAVRGCVWLKKRGEPGLRPVAYKNQPASPDEGRRSAEHSLPVWVQQNGQAVLLTAAPHPSLIPYTRPGQDRLAPLSIRLSKDVSQETLAVPIAVSNRMMGVMTKPKRLLWKPGSNRWR